MNGTAQHCALREILNVLSFLYADMRVTNGVSRYSVGHQ